MGNNDPNTEQSTNAYTVRRPTTCPHCGALQNAHSNTVAIVEQPENGDISFCTDCGRFSAYADKAPGKLRTLKAKEHKFVAADRRCTMLKHQWAEWRKQQGTQ